MISKLHSEVTLKFFAIAPSSTRPLGQIPEMPAASLDPWTLEKNRVGEGRVKKRYDLFNYSFKIYLPISQKHITTWACEKVLPPASKGLTLKLKHHALHSQLILSLYMNTVS